MDQKHTVLVIDDYAPARDAVRFALKNEFDCLSAESAREGLEILKAKPVDVVVLDIRMPEMDGIQALRRVREMGIDSQVILLTGYGSLESARKAVRYGAFDYLIKPFNVDNLRNVVREAAQKKKLLEKEGRDSEFKKLTEALTVKFAEASRSARVGELSSDALREMKNPITAILGYTQMLLKNLKDRRIRLLSTKSMRYLSIIEEEAKRCAEIASMLASVSEQQGSQDGAMVNEVVLNVAALMRPQCSMKRVELAANPPSEEIIVDVPPDDMHGVLVSLVLNSVEAIEGPGEITIKGYGFRSDDPMAELLTPSEKAFIQGAGEGSLVGIEVSDTGCGIDPQYVDRIFEPFFTTKSERSSAGLGLSICKQMIERKGGHIGVVVSRPGETTMRVLLPVSSMV